MIRSDHILATALSIAVLLGELAFGPILQASPRSSSAVKPSAVSPKKKIKLEEVRLGMAFGRSVAANTFGPFAKGSKEHANVTYLNDTKKNLDLEARNASVKEVMGFQYSLLEDGQVLSYRERLRAQQREEEIREHHRLEIMSRDQLPENVKANQENMRSELVRNVGTNTGKVYTRRLRRAVDNDPNLAKIRTPAGIILGAVAISQGEPVKWDVSESTRVTAHGKVQDRAGQLSLSTKIVDSGFSYNGKVPKVSAWDGIPGATPEHMNFSVSRSLPWIQTNSSLSYGMSSNTVTAGLSRPIITPNLTAIVGTTRTVGEQRLGFKSDERVQLVYGINF